MSDFSKFAPASLDALRAQEAAGGAVPAPVATDAGPAPSPAPVAPPVAARAPAPASSAPRFVGGKVRMRTIPLDYHLEYEGRTYTSITLRRPTSIEIGQWYERLFEEAKTEPDARVRFPIFEDEDGNPIPGAVLDALDGEDDERVMGAAGDFLPPRLRVLWVDPRPASTPPIGEPTAPTSST